MTFYVATYKIKVPISSEIIKVIITVNDQDNRPFEIFIRSSSQQFSEHVEIVFIFISHMLRDGQKLETVAKYLLSIFSSYTGHMKQGGYCPSVYARIGEILSDHSKKYQ
jgi:hypothetical protein